MSPAELITIVDERDCVIGAKLRDECTHADIFRISGLWLTNSKGLIMLAQRTWNKKSLPGLWGSAAAGTVAEGESYQENIYREATEEIGLSGVKFQLGPKIFFDSGERRAFYTWYTVVLDRALDGYFLQPEEVERVLWFSPGDLRAQLNQNPEKFVPVAGMWPQLFL